MDEKDIIKIIKKTNVLTCNPRLWVDHDNLIKNLADQLEEEDSRCHRCNRPMKKTKKYGKEQFICDTYNTPLVKDISFNRKQFLKKLGVKE